MPKQQPQAPQLQQITEAQVLREITLHNRDERQHALSELRQKAAYIARKMAQVVVEIDSRGLDATVNSAGEIQREGTEIDMLCARFDQLNRAHRELVTLVSRVAVSS